MKLSGIIFSDTHRGFDISLTKNRTSASVPFGGRYRFIDFALSNMTNSGISSICAVTGQNSRSLMDHVGGGSVWDLSRKGADFFVLPSVTAPFFRGSLEAMAGCRDFVKRCDADYIVLCDSSVLCNIDYRNALESHIKSGADITAVCNSISKEYELDSEDLNAELREGRVTKLYTGWSDGNTCTGMGMYIMTPSILADALDVGTKSGKYSFEKDYLVPGFNNGSVKVNAFVFDGVVLRNPNAISYFKNNFLTNNTHVRKELFRSDSPIRTKVRDSGPAVLRRGASLKNTTVADGCIIRGTLQDCILFRDVVVDEGASVRGSILMQGTHIGKNAEVSYTVTDKNVTVSQGAVLSGAPSAPLIISKGVTV